MSQDSTELKREPETFVTAIPHEDHEYLFRRFPDGKPPGQIKAFVRRKGSEKRVPLKRLPTPQLQNTFVALTGKKPEELGLVASDGAW